MRKATVGAIAAQLGILLAVSCGGSESPSQADFVPTSTVDSSAKSQSRAVDVWWPALDTSWQWQLNGLPIDRSFDVDMYDIDLFDTDGSLVATLQGEGRKVVCYVNAGGWKEWRPDASLFPEELIGANLDEWEGERWLDIRRLDLLAPIMEARIDLCEAKGFDGIEPDNVDGYLNDTGFPLTYEEQLN